MQNRQKYVYHGKFEGNIFEILLLLTQKLEVNNLFGDLKKGNQLSQIQLLNFEKAKLNRVSQHQQSFMTPQKWMN